MLSVNVCRWENKSEVNLDDSVPEDGESNKHVHVFLFFIFLCFCF